MCADLDGQRNYHVQFFKFMAASPLAVRTKVRAAPHMSASHLLTPPSHNDVNSSLQHTTTTTTCSSSSAGSSGSCPLGPRVQRYFLEVAIENSMPGPLLVDAVELQPAAPGIQCWKIKPAPAILQEPAAAAAERAAAGGATERAQASAASAAPAAGLADVAGAGEGLLAAAGYNGLSYRQGKKQHGDMGEMHVTNGHLGAAARANGQLANGIADLSLREEDTVPVRDVGTPIAAAAAAAHKQYTERDLGTAHNGYHYQQQQEEGQQQQQQQLVQAEHTHEKGGSGVNGFVAKEPSPLGPLAEYISSLAQPLYAAGGVRHYLWEVYQVEQHTAAAAAAGDGGSGSGSRGEGLGGAEVPAAAAIVKQGSAAAATGGGGVVSSSSGSSGGGGPSPVLGKLDICWSGLNGEVGRLQTQAVMWPGPRGKEVQLHLEGIRVSGGAELLKVGGEGEGGGLWTVPLEQPFQVVLGVSVGEKVKRESSSHGDVGKDKGGVKVGPLELLFTEMVAPTGQRRSSVAASSRGNMQEEHEDITGGAGVAALGSRRASLGCLQPGTSTTVAFDCIALQPGWQVLPPIVLVMDGKALDSVHDVEVLVS